tara:strand:- start:1090 stop:3453 length:2364 start_codon:yes stop_codon:yes gene_type:complete
VGALNRKLWRDLWRIKGQGLAISLVIGCGVAAFVMALGMLYSLQETRAAYYERYRFAEVFAPVKRAPQSLLPRLSAISGVKRVETRIVRHVVLDIAGMVEPATGRLVSLPERGQPVLNDVYIRAGRGLTPGRPDEVLIGEAMALAHGFGPGDRIKALLNGRKRELVIVGVALSPEHVYSIAPGGFVPDDRHFGVLWMSRPAMAAAFDLDGAFSEATLTLLRGASEPAVIAEVDRLLEPYGGSGAFGRKDQVSDAYLEGEMKQLATMAKLLPPIFLGVAAFLLNIVASRLVATEREQIGLMKAFGYANWEVGWHYLKLMLLVALIGIAAGFAAGDWLGRGLAEIYTDFFRFPFLHYRTGPAVFAGAALISLAATVLGTLGAVRRAVALPPAEAMQPAPPPTYRRSTLEHLGVAHFADQPTRMIIRHLTRWPVRSGLTSLGIAMAAAVMVSTLFFLDSIEQMIHVNFFLAQRQDLSVTFVEPRHRRALHEISRLSGVQRSEPFHVIPTRLRNGSLHRRQAIVGIERDSDLHRLIDRSLSPVAIPERGIVLARKLAELLDVGLGDRLAVEVLEGQRPRRQVRVSAIIEEYIGLSAYMDLRALNSLMQEGAAVSGAFLMIDREREGPLYRALKATPVVAAVSSQTSALESFRKTMAENLVIMVWFYVMFAGLIAFGVVYNSARISLSERGRELACLRVMGFTRFEVSYILLGELAVLTLLALPMGSAIGYGLAALMVKSFDTELYRLPLVIWPATYGYAMLVVVIAALVSGLLVRRRIDSLDLVSVLKTRE